MTRGRNSAAEVSAGTLQRWLQVLAWEHARVAHGARGPSPHEPGVDVDGRRAAALAMLAAVADLEDTLVVVKAAAVAAAGEAGARHGDVAAALRVTRQAVSSRWWRHLASHPGRPAADAEGPRRVDVDEQQRRRAGHLDAAAQLATGLGRDRGQRPPALPAQRARVLPPSDGWLF
ncbi:MAG TPA: hypothetical protein VGL02_16345 [Streptomyces sp.]